MLSRNYPGWTDIKPITVTGFRVKIEAGTSDVTNSKQERYSLDHNVNLHYEIISMDVLVCSDRRPFSLDINLQTDRQ